MENRSALDYYERALALAGPEEGWGVREARVLAGMGESRYWRSEYAEALDVLDRADELGRAREDDWAISLALRFHADIALNMDGDVEWAEQLFAQSLAAAEALDESFAVSRTLLFAGWVPWSREDYGAAEDTWKRALALAEANDDDWARVRALTSISVSRADQDDFDEAQRLIEQALEVANDLGDQFSVAVTIVQVGRLLAYTEHAEEAAEYFDARDRDLRGVRRAVGAGRRAGRAGDRLPRAGAAGRGRGRPPDVGPDLRGAGRAAARRGRGGRWPACPSSAATGPRPRSGCAGPKRKRRAAPSSRARSLG